MKYHSILTILLLLLKSLPFTNCFGPTLHKISTQKHKNMATKTQQWRCNSSNDANTAVKESEAEAEAFPSLKIVGICGAIGSGKSYASSLLTSKINELSDMTAHHIDTDSLAHGVYAPGSKAIDEIGDEFGEHVISNGTVDRKALGSIVFSNNSKMQVSNCSAYTCTFNVELLGDYELFHFTNNNTFHDSFTEIGKDCLASCEGTSDTTNKRYP
jgi:hypothetical protein